MLTTLAALLLVLASFGIALATLVTLTLLRQRKEQNLQGIARKERGNIVFLFRDEALADATDAARNLLSFGPSGGTDWARLLHILTPRFPDLGPQMADLASLGEVTLTSVDGTSHLTASWQNGTARIALGDTPDANMGQPADTHAVAAMQDELETLRATAAAVPYPIWRQGPGGVITWANRAYLDLCEKMEGSTPLRPWPPATLFRPEGEMQLQAGLAKYRLPLDLPDSDGQSWFDVFEAELGDEHLYTAAPADALIRAETVLSEFVTTLSKTFAHLPIGLAIFDRNRRLVLFNPALSDLTTLPASFLVSRPMLFSFFDHLRDKRMMPEPKNYAGWRQKMAELEKESASGTYEETWTLPGGQTYRITGRPHPDGALAILFEDISAEISLTRRFRAELELNQSALDAMPDAMALFARNGTLVSSNTAYSELWGVDPSEVLGDLSLESATQSWSEKTAPTRVWASLLEYAHLTGERQVWTASIALRDGRIVECRVSPVARGATLVVFTPHRAEAVGILPVSGDSLVSSV